jgi:hypothetical protein
VPEPFPLADAFVGAARRFGSPADVLFVAAAYRGPPAAPADLVHDRPTQVGRGIVDRVAAPPSVHGRERVGDDVLGQARVAGQEVRQPQRCVLLGREHVDEFGSCI